jgi:hypothetical protein
LSFVVERLGPDVRPTGWWRLNLLTQDFEPACRDERLARRRVMCGQPAPQPGRSSPDASSVDRQGARSSDKRASSDGKSDAMSKAIAAATGGAGDPRPPLLPAVALPAGSRVEAGGATLAPASEIRRRLTDRWRAAVACSSGCSAGVPEATALLNVL